MICDFFLCFLKFAHQKKEKIRKSEILEKKSLSFFIAIFNGRLQALHMEQQLGCWDDTEVQA